MLFSKTFAFAAALFGFAFGAWAQAPYATLIPPQTTVGGGQIEVVEFFWYGCQHCYNLEPDVISWERRAPKDVVFKRVPAIPSDAWGEGAKIFYTLEAMGLLDQYHQKVFDTIHRENVNLHNKGLREQWLKKNGIDVTKYNETEKSFTVSSKLTRARQMTQSYKVDSVPRVVVNGKYYTSGQQAGGAHRVFAVVDQLVEMARRDSPTTAETAPAIPTQPAKK